MVFVTLGKTHLNNLIQLNQICVLYSSNTVKDAYDYTGIDVLARDEFLIILGITKNNYLRVLSSKGTGYIFDDAEFSTKVWYPDE
jgi:hypothetical protein